MRIRTGLCLAVGCCAALTACAAAGPKGPDATVTTPAVGRPPTPVSAQAALSGEAFSPYAALGLSSNDGLAPGESKFALVGPCMSAAGFPGVTFSDGLVSLPVSIVGGLAYAQPWGGWGYLGAADAQQYGFQVLPGAATLGIALPASSPSVPAAEQDAASRCGTIIQDFADDADGALAGIITLSDDITADVGHDPAVQAATRAWSACMAKNGYSFGKPQNVFFQEWQVMYGGQSTVSPSAPVGASANRAQLATAVTDADCTKSSDLAGIYFAVQASYERQLVNANQQALNAAVREYKASYARELSKLPALLRATSATSALLRGPARPRGPAATSG
jgi:hypothetical protein